MSKRKIGNSLESRLSEIAGEKLKIRSMRLVEGYLIEAEGKDINCLAIVDKDLKSITYFKRGNS